MVRRLSKIARPHTRFPLSTAPPWAARIRLRLKPPPRPRSFASGRGSKSHCAMSNAQVVLFPGPRSQRSRSNVFRLRAVPRKQTSQRRYLQPTRSAWRPSKNALTGSSLIPTVTSHACRRRVSLPKRDCPYSAGTLARSCRTGLGMRNHIAEMTADIRAKPASASSPPAKLPV